MNQMTKRERVASILEKSHFEVNKTIYKLFIKINNI